MTTMSLTEARKHPLGEVVEQVCARNEALVVTGPDGELAKVVPVPKPVRHFKGRPVYRLEDAQHLDFPYWNREPAKP